MLHVVGQLSTLYMMMEEHEVVERAVDKGPRAVSGGAGATIELFWGPLAQMRVASARGRVNQG